MSTRGKKSPPPQQPSSSTPVSQEKMEPDSVPPERRRAKKQPVVANSAPNPSADNTPEERPNDITEANLDPRLTLSNTDPDKRYFVYFIHELGRHGDNMPIKVGASNDVGEYRKKTEAERENGLKTHAAIKCLKGDAENVISHFVRKYANNHMRNGWFTGGKPIVDEFIADMEKMGYEKITEGRAKLLKGNARKRVPAAIPS